MPRTAINYQNTIIYKIVCNDLNIKDVYVGHTTDFTRRRKHHKCACTNLSSKEYNIKTYQIIRNNGGWDNWCMVEIEKIPCYDSNEARARERYWFEQLQASLNSKYPIRSGKEYRQDTKEMKKEYDKKNQEKIKEHKKEYQKEFYIKNKERIDASNKEYNKKILTCVCGSMFTQCYKSRHNKTKKHINFLESQKIIM